MRIKSGMEIRKNMDNYAAGIIVYNPKFERIKENIEAIIPQVKVLYCYNNGLGENKKVVNLLKSHQNLVILGNGHNDGISKALNCMIDQAEKDGMQWLLTLDQDSVACNNMIESLTSLTNIEKVGIICPQIRDARRKNEQTKAVTIPYEDVDICFTSGSFMNVQATKAIGGFDEYLFIDFVDHDICLRMRYEGYRVVRNNNVVLDHELGNLKPSRFERLYLKLGGMLHNEGIKKLSYKREVNPVRVYYATRNMIYMKKKFSNYISSRVWDKRLMKNVISYVLRGEKKIDIIKSINRGLNDGKKKHVKPYVTGRGAES